MLEAARQEGGLPTGYIDDVALLVTGDSPTSNCRVIERLHSKTAEKWANTHGAKFGVSKYELIHFTRNPVHAREMKEVQVTIDHNSISPSISVKWLYHGKPAPVAPANASDLHQSKQGNWRSSQTH